MLTYAETCSFVLKTVMDIKNKYVSDNPGIAVHVTVDKNDIQHGIATVRTHVWLENMSVEGEIMNNSWTVYIFDIAEMYEISPDNAKEYIFEVYIDILDMLGDRVKKKIRKRR